MAQIEILFGLMGITFVIVVSPISLAFFLQWLGKRSVLFTMIKEGSAKAIMRGGSFDRMIMSFEGYHLHYKGCPGYDHERWAEWQVLYHGPNNLNGFEGDHQKDETYDKRPWLLKKLGLYWVGWPWASNVYIYEFEWNETVTVKEGDEQILTRREATDFIFVEDFPYGIVVEGAETNDLLPTRVIVIITVAVSNPYNAMFRTQDWMRRITASITREIRLFVGTQTYGELISTRKDGAQDNTPAGQQQYNKTKLSKPIIDLNDKLPDNDDIGLERLYGILIKAADLLSIVLAGDAKKQNETAATAVFVAEREAEAIRKKGQANADVVVMMGDAETKALQKRLAVIRDNGPEGIRLAELDAMESAGKGPGTTIVWPNTLNLPTPVLPIEKK
jgi:regulator of protease activity HflC (stomatin/prohibitin superfamily)